VGSQQGFECVVSGITRIVNNGTTLDITSEAARKCIQAISARVSAAKASS
jgi:hypothetical protein